MSDRLLAEAWRDLAGWHVGMVTRCEDGAQDVVVCLDPDDDDEPVELWGDGWCWSEDWLPALGSPANWGHWIDFVHHKVGELEIELTADCSIACSYDMDTAHADESLPLALLESFCAHMDNMVKHGLEESRPPSVLTWWKSQQGEVSDG